MPDKITGTGSSGSFAGGAGGLAGGAVIGAGGPGQVVGSIVERNAAAVGGVNDGNGAVGFLAGKNPFVDLPVGAYGQSDHTGVIGIANNANGVGVYGGGRGGIAVGVMGEAGTGLAGKFIGNVEVTGDIRLTQGRDIAELFHACPDAQLLPGSVMVIDPEGMLTPSTEAYDSRVVGIVSSGGDLRPAMILGGGHPEGTASIAMLGTTYCQADASDAPILPGDLLVSGKRKGHAMKALDSFRRVGAIIGKSLERLDSGQGLVRIVVTLQ